MPQTAAKAALANPYLRALLDAVRSLDAAGRLAPVSEPEQTGWRVTARPPKGRDGQWWQLRLYPPGGGPSKQRTARPARTREEAEKAAAKLEAQLNGTAESLLVEVQRAHLAWLGRVPGTPRPTLAGHGTALARVGEALGSDLSATALERLRSDLVEEGLSGRTINNYIRLTRTAWRWGVGQGLCAGEWPEIGWLTERDTILRPATPEETVALLLHWERRGGWEATYWALVAGCGSRVMETAELCEEDVDRAGRSVTFRDSRTKTTERTAAVPAEVMERLPVGDPRLWPGLNYQAVNRSWLTAKKACGLTAEPITAHSLRRGWIADAFESGAPLPHIMAQVGHERPETTLRYERRAKRRDLAASARRVAEFRSSVGDPHDPHGNGGGSGVDSGDPEETQSVATGFPHSRAGANPHSGRDSGLPIVGVLRGLPACPAARAALLGAFGGASG